MRIYLLSLISLLFFTACAQKVNITTFEPASVDRVSKTKKISILEFQNDSVGFSSLLESLIAKKRVYDEAYFTVVSRNELNKILDEQKLQYSGLVDKNTTVRIGHLIGVQALISGNVIDSSFNKSHYYATRLRCIDKKCKEMREYLVSCTKANYNLDVSIKISDVEFGDIIYADTFNKSRTYSHCKDESGTLPNFGNIMNKFSNDISNEFISKISPNKRVLSIELLDDPEIDYTDKQDELLEYSLKYIESNRYDKAEQLLSELLTSTNDKCYVAAYNLAVIKEANSQYELAKQLYDLSDNLVLEPNDIINKAVNRINNQLQNKKILDKQIEN